MSRRTRLWFGIRVFEGDLGAWAKQAMSLASYLPVYDGDQDRSGWIVARARWYLPAQRALVCLTRDNLVKMGWWKNADFANCFHLSISFRSPSTSARIDWSNKHATEIVTAAFGRNASMCWWEPPYSDRGKQLGVEHWRLFMAADWKTSIQPKGEPYTMNVPKGWSEWTEYQAAQATPHLNQDITDEVIRRREP